MDIENFLSSQEPGRQALLKKTHAIICKADKSVTPSIGSMMGKTMILYNQHGTMKYGLASVKNYMSLHVLPMYMNKFILEKYKGLLPGAVFQKGCINFTSAEEMPVTIIEKLIRECAPFDLKKVREDYLKAKKVKSK
ncbi:MAG: DUF1801 domain-containing protein [Chitinophagaceae bacterium]